MRMEVANRFDSLGWIAQSLLCFAAYSTSRFCYLAFLHGLSSEMKRHLLRFGLVAR